MPVILVKTAQSRYTENYRKEMLTIGFAHTSAFVHEADKKLLLAHAEIMRYERMIDLVMRDNEAVLELAVKRNRAKKRSKEEIAALRTLIEGNERTKDQALGMLKAYTSYLKRASGYEHDVQVEPENDFKFALSILFNNLSGACYKYAEALATYEQPVSI